MIFPGDGEEHLPGVSEPMDEYSSPFYSLKFMDKRYHKV